MLRLARLAAVASLAAACGPAKKPPVYTPPPPPPPPQVAVSDPQLVTLDAALGNTFAPADRDADVIARLRIDTRDLPSTERPPLRLTLVIDTSGSMEGEAIDRARDAALAMVDGLAPGDWFALVVFHSSAEVLVPNTVIDAHNRDDIRTKIRAMTASGTTDMAGGLQVALAQASASLDAQMINRIVLLSDGIPNDPTQITAMAQQAANYGMPITTLGLGLEYDETLLAGVAKASGGTFHYIEKNDQVVEVFKGELVRMKRLVARQMYLQLQPGPGVTIQSVIGFTAQPTGGRGVYVSLGDLSQGEQRDVLVRMKVTGHRDGARVELADAILNFQDAVQNAGALTRKLFLSMTATTDEAQLRQGRNPEIEKAAARAELAAAVVQAIALARGGAVDQARQTLDAAEPLAIKDARRLDDASLRTQLAELPALRKALPTLQPPPPPVPVGQPAPEPPRQATADEARTVREAHEAATKPFQPAPRDHD